MSSIKSSDDGNNPSSLAPQGTSPPGDQQTVAPAASTQPNNNITAVSASTVTRSGSEASSSSRQATKAKKASNSIGIAAATAAGAAAAAGPTSQPPPGHQPLSILLASVQSLVARLGPLVTPILHWATYISTWQDRTVSLSICLVWCLVCLAPRFCIVYGPHALLLMLMGHHFAERRRSGSKNAKAAPLKLPPLPRLVRFLTRILTDVHKHLDLIDTFVARLSWKSASDAASIRLFQGILVSYAAWILINSILPLGVIIMIVGLVVIGWYSDVGENVRETVLQEWAKARGKPITASAIHSSVRAVAVELVNQATSEAQPEASTTLSNTTSSETPKTTTEVPLKSSSAPNNSSLAPPANPAVESLRERPRSRASSIVRMGNFEATVVLEPPKPVVQPVVAESSPVPEEPSVDEEEARREEERLLAAEQEAVQAAKEAQVAAELADAAEEAAVAARMAAAAAAAEAKRVAEEQTPDPTPPLNASEDANVPYELPADSTDAAAKPPGFKLVIPERGSSVTNDSVALGSKSPSSVVSSTSKPEQQGAGASQESAIPSVTSPSQDKSAQEPLSPSSNQTSEDPSVVAARRLQNRLAEVAEKRVKEAAAAKKAASQAAQLAEEKVAAMHAAAESASIHRITMHGSGNIRASVDPATLISLVNNSAAGLPARTSSRVHSQSQMKTNIGNLSGLRLHQVVADLPSPTREGEPESSSLRRRVRAMGEARDGREAAEYSEDGTKTEVSLTSKKSDNSFTAKESAASRKPYGSLKLSDDEEEDNEDGPRTRHRDSLDQTRRGRGRPAGPATPTTFKEDEEDESEYADGVSYSRSRGNPWDDDLASFMMQASEPGDDDPANPAGYDDDIDAEEDLSRLDHYMRESELFSARQSGLDVRGRRISTGSEGTVDHHTIRRQIIESGMTNESYYQRQRGNTDQAMYNQYQDPYSVASNTNNVYARGYSVGSMPSRPAAVSTTGPMQRSAFDVAKARSQSAGLPNRPNMAFSLAGGNRDNNNTTNAISIIPSTNDILFSTAKPMSPRATNRAQSTASPTSQHPSSPNLSSSLVFHPPTRQDRGSASSAKSSLRGGVGSPSIAAMGKPLDVVLSFECFENQRWWVGLGWVAHLLPAERQGWTDFHGTRVTPRESFELLPFRAEQLMAWKDEVPLDVNMRYAWEWDGPWYVDVQGGGQMGDVDEEGWSYADNFWKDWKNKKTLKRVVRHRRWVRQARLFELGPKQNVKFSIQRASLENAIPKTVAIAFPDDEVSSF